MRMTGDADSLLLHCLWLRWHVCHFDKLIMANRRHLDQIPIEMVSHVY
jgi:hypothetical protein